MNTLQTPVCVSMSGKQQSGFVLEQTETDNGTVITILLPKTQPLANAANTVCIAGIQFEV